MPIFEYVCEDCRNSFETLVRNGEEVYCPACNGGHLSKQYSNFGMTTGSSEKRQYESLPLYKSGCGCNPGGCGCKN